MCIRDRFITSSWGLGETVVQGAVNPDEFYVYKPALRSGHESILRRTLGAKALKMIYAPAEQAEKRVLTVDVSAADRSRFSIDDEDARELGIPAVVGCGNATTTIHEGQEVTVSCAEGDTGFVYD